MRRLLLVRFIAVLSIDVHGEGQIDIGVGWVNQCVTYSVDVIDREFIATAPRAGPYHSWTEGEFHATEPEGRFVGRTDPKSSGAAETKEMSTPEVRSIVTLIEAAITESRTGSLVVTMNLLVACVPRLVLLLAGTGVSFRRVLIGIALVAIGIAFVAVGVALGIVGPGRIVLVVLARLLRAILRLVIIILPWRRRMWSGVLRRGVIGRRRVI